MATSVKLQLDETYKISTPFFIFVGKGAKPTDQGKGKWVKSDRNGKDGVRDQLAKGCREAASEEKFNCWAAGAIGSEVRFYCFVKGEFKDVRFEGYEFLDWVETMDLRTKKGYEKIVMAMGYANAYPR